MHEWCYRGERWLTACSSGKTLRQQLWSTGAFESTSAYLKLTKLLVLSQQIKFPFGFLRIILLTANNVLFLWYVVLTPFSEDSLIRENLFCVVRGPYPEEACIHILCCMYQYWHIKLKLLYGEKCEQIRRCDISCSLRGILVVFFGGNVLIWEWTK